MSDIEKETQYLLFIFRERAKKTNVYEVASKTHGICLGIIKWKPTWRQYCFFPYEGTHWNHQCLKDVEDFLVSENEIHKEKIRGEKKKSLYTL